MRASFIVALALHLVVAAAIVGCRQPLSGKDTACDQNDVGKSPADAMCIPTGYDGIADCGGIVTDTKVSDKNCGACGQACAAGKGCVNAVCRTVDPACTKQAPDFCGGECADLLTNQKHCGGCGAVCQAGKVCSGGTCLFPCNGKEEALCNGACANLKTDRNNCGRCGRMCGGTKDSPGACIDGACQRL